MKAFGFGSRIGEEPWFVSGFASGAPGFVTARKACVKPRSFAILLPAGRWCLIDNAAFVYMLDLQTAAGRTIPMATHVGLGYAGMLRAESIHSIA
jgi:hypothetical protein